MKLSTITLGVSILILLTGSAALCQQQYTQTVTSSNRYCNNVCSIINVPALNNNPSAVIFITPGTANYAHPIGAYYMNLGQWSVFNLDNTPISVGATFNVEFYASPDAAHFVYVAPPLVHSNDVRFIDHAGLNNNPSVQVRVFPTNSPPAGVAGATFNKISVDAAYDLTTAKWFIYNRITPPAPVPAGTAYSVNISGNSPLPIATPTPTAVPFTTPTPGSAGNPGTPYLPPLTLAPPASAVPTGPAGGDLTGTYPNPKVVGLQGRPISSTAPTVGQVLRWNGTEWKPAAEAVATPSGESIQAFFKNPGFNSTLESNLQRELSDNKSQRVLPFVSHTIMLTKRSRLLISVSVDTVGPFCQFGCNDGEGDLFIQINNNKEEKSRMYVAARSYNTSVVTFMPDSVKVITHTVIDNYGVELDPGTYNIDFVVKHKPGSSPFQPFERFSSVVVFPIQ